MPLWRYFAFTGSFLLALLLLADWYLPTSSAEPAHAGVDKTIIRIQSSQRWPEAVVFDTNRPTVSPPLVAADAGPLETPPAVERSPREAFAELSPTPPVRAVPSERAVKKDAAPKKVAARHPVRTRAPVRRLASYQPAESRGFFQFGW